MTMKKPVQERNRREHGDATRARIIEVAGSMFAEHGFANVTGKNVCEKIGINITSANYHFGSRDGLRVAVIREVFDFVMGSDFMEKLAEPDVPPREKLARFIATLASVDKYCWQINYKDHRLFLYGEWQTVQGMRVPSGSSISQYMMVILYLPLRMDRV